MIRQSFLVPLSVFGLLVLPAVGRADAVAEMKGFSGMEGVSLPSLADGKALVCRGGGSGSPRDLSVQACYVVALPPQRAVELHRQWNGARHPELKVYWHRALPAKPAEADFLAGFNGVRGNEAVRALAAATEKRGELQMSGAEARQLGKGGGGAGAGGGALSQPVAAFWSGLLAARASAFAAGGMAGQPPYEGAGGTVRVAEEAARLLKEQPRLREEFKPLLEEAGLFNGGGKLPPSLYAELIDVEGRAAFTLGAAYARAAGDGGRACDIQYYCGEGYFVLLTFYRFWPVTMPSGKAATLVWRGDLVSSAALAELRGVERMGSAGAMMKEIEASIACLQRDAAAGR